MIPGKILRFLEERANVAHGGTRDSGLVPRGHRVCGWRVADDHRTLTALVPQQFVPHLLESLQAHHRFAVTIEDFPAHENYQFKCRYLRHRAVEPEDLQVVDRIRERFVRNIGSMFFGVNQAMLRAFILPPALAVECEVLEIYLQTPGPGAGARLLPAEA